MVEEIAEVRADCDFGFLAGNLFSLVWVAFCWRSLKRLQVDTIFDKI